MQLFPVLLSNLFCANLTLPCSLLAAKKFRSNLRNFSVTKYVHKDWSVAFQMLAVQWCLTVELVQAWSCADGESLKLELLLRSWRIILVHLVRLVSTILHSCLSLCILGIKEAVINLQLKSLGVKTTVRTRGIREMLLGIFFFFFFKITTKNLRRVGT